VTNKHSSLTALTHTKLAGIKTVTGCKCKWCTTHDMQLPFLLQFSEPITDRYSLVRIFIIDILDQVMASAHWTRKRLPRQNEMR